MIRREMRRKDRVLSELDAIDILNKVEYGVLSTVSEDGSPYGVPINFVYVQKHIYFHSALVGYKIDNILAHPQVSFTVVSDVHPLAEQFSTKYKSVIVFGTVEEVDDTEKSAVFRYFLEKFSADFMDPGIIYVEKTKGMARIFRINIEYMSVKGK